MGKKKEWHKKEWWNNPDRPRHQRPSKFSLLETETGIITPDAKQEVAARVLWLESTRESFTTLDFAAGSAIIRLEELALAQIGEHLPDEKANELQRLHRDRLDRDARAKDGAKSRMEQDMGREKAWKQRAEQRDETIECVRACIAEFKGSSKTVISTSTVRGKYRKTMRQKSERQAMIDEIRRKCRKPNGDPFSRSYIYELVKDILISPVSRRS
ncbi:MAG: hypothetical protein ABSG85_13100 [Spirochaetia bacterium]